MLPVEKVSIASLNRWALLICLQAYSSAPPNEADKKSECKEQKLEAKEEVLGLVGHLVIYAIAAGGLYGWTRYDDWRRAKNRKAEEELRANEEKVKKERKANELQSKNERIAKETKRKAKRKAAKAREIEFLELQEQIKILNPRFRPGDLKEKMAKEEKRARKQLECEILDVLCEPKDDLIRADPESHDPTEKIAARLGDPAQRDRLRDMWDKIYSLNQEGLRERVRNKMGKFGIQWPEKGNLFGDDDVE
ncbi:MAG: hypothetical protein Q9221_002100 [Calogaya cf. arnoldii]